MACLEPSKLIKILEPSREPKPWLALARRENSAKRENKRERRKKRKKNCFVHHVFT